MGGVVHSIGKAVGSFVGVRAPTPPPPPTSPTITRLAQDAANTVQSREAADRRLRASKSVKNVLTSGLGIVGKAPVGVAVLSPTRSVLG